MLTKFRGFVLLVAVVAAAPAAAAQESVNQATISGRVVDA